MACKVEYELWEMQLIECGMVVWWWFVMWHDIDAYVVQIGFTSYGSNVDDLWNNKNWKALSFVLMFYFLLEVFI